MIVNVIQREDPICNILQQEIMVHLMFSQMNKKQRPPVQTTLRSASIVWLLDECTLLFRNNKGLHRVVLFLIIITA